jgi:hypothetical protein
MLTFFSLISLFWKNETRFMQSPCCVCVCLCLSLSVCVCVWDSLPINFRMPESVFMKLGMYIMTPEPISAAYFINPSHQSVCLCVFLVKLLGKDLIKCIPPLIAMQWLGKHIPMATNTHNNRIIVGCMCVWTCLCISLSLLSNNSVKTFPPQWRIAQVVIFYVVHVISKKVACLTWGQK